MARLLQRLAAAIGVASTCGAAEFSHKQHVELKLTCVACHSAATTSTRADQNNRPDPAFCITCHKDPIRPVTPPRATLVTKFNHQLHLKLGNTAPVIAEAIRRGTYLAPVPAGYLQKLDTQNACLACHAAIDQAASLETSYLPPMASCLVCHNKVDAPFSCAKCHAETPALKPATHTADYIDRHSTGKANLDKPSCAVCHGRRFTCLGCH